MKNFMKTILSGIQAWTRGEIRKSAADWSQNDPNVDSYVKNRTHYDSRYRETINITFDGILDEKEYLDISGNGDVYFVKVSDLAPSAKEVTGGVISVTENGEVIAIVEITEDLINQLSSSLYYLGEGEITVVLEDTNFNDLMWTKGIWFVMEPATEALPSFYPNNLSYTKENGELKKLDSKYLNLPTNLATTDDVQEAVQEAVGLASAAQSTANTAITNAATAQSTADNALTTANKKMDKENPIGTGRMTVGSNCINSTGKNSQVFGTGGESYSNDLSVFGKYNITEKYKLSSYTTGQFFVQDDTKLYYCYELKIDPIKGTIYMVNPTQSDVDSVTYRVSVYEESLYASYSLGENNSVSNPYYFTPDMSTMSGTSNGKPASGFSNPKRMQAVLISSSQDGQYAHIIGNGTSGTARSNAHTLDWEGNAWYSGDVYVGSTSGTNKDEGSKKLATEESVHDILIATGLITPEDIDAICGVTT